MKGDGVTDFIGVQAVSQWIAERGAENIIKEMVEYLAADFSRWADFDKKPRVANHSPIGVIELMPASDADLYTFKYVNGHPSNPARGYQTVTAFGVLAEVHNGYPVMISEMTLVTALRTAAASALAAKILARPDSRKLALIGAGCQAEFQSLGMRAVLGINEIAVWDVDPKAIEKYVVHAEKLGFKVRIATSAADAVAGADIVTTCTADKQHAIVLHDSMVCAGMHINAIGGDCPGKTELETDILYRSSVFVEYEPQTRIEGEIQKVNADFPVTELWKVVTGFAPGRVDDKQITVFDSVGFAVEDFSALRYLRESLQGSSLVTQVDIVADPEDPKDLYSLIGSYR